MKLAIQQCEARFIDQVCSAIVEMQEDAAENVAMAMAQLDAGTYGYCLDCLCSIPAARLSAITFAIRCEDCERSRVLAAAADELRA